ncbi:MAG TPA: PspC domain-containing protein [Opitutaceae bacterium]|nr:PspC domain-containing protein [Opitutaceae bacterium]
MNKVITINLGGTAYQLEEAGYDALRAYLETAATRLQGNPDRDEILSDIEQAIGEKFRARLGSYKTVIVTKEVTAALAEMGPIEDDSAAEESAGAEQKTHAAPEGFAAASASDDTPRRLYRVSEGEMLHGVCNGLAAYFGFDPTFVRIGFVLLTIFWGMGILVYFAMVIIVPRAVSPEQKAAAYGTPFRAQEFIRRAKAGYYESAKAFPDRHARREWKRRFKEEMRGWRASFRREMRMHAASAWGPPAGGPGIGLTLPLLSALQGAISILWLCAIVSVVATGTLFGAALPVSVPVWLVVVVLILAFGILKWPIKAARRACYYGWGGTGSAWRLVLLVEAMVWLALLGILLSLMCRFLPQLLDAARNLPGVIHEAVNNIRDWWKTA